jgi:AraC-like DNA-binding protein
LASVVVLKVEGHQMESTQIGQGSTQSDRLQIYQDVVCRALVSLAVKVTEPDRFEGFVASHPVGTLTVTDIHSQPQDVRRTSRLISRDEKRYLKVGMLLDGQCVVTQRDREATLARGDLVCYDTAVPYAFHMKTPFRLAVFMLPADGVEHRLRGFEGVTAVSIAGDKGLGGVAAGVLRSVLAGVGTYGGEAAVHVSSAVTDIVAGLVAERAGLAPDEDAAHAAVKGSVHRYIELNLSNPQLSPATIAAAAGISVRYLYKLFEQDGTPVSAWIRDRRLDQVARDLSDPRLAHRTVAAVGAQWGFRDAANFSRAFRLREGIAPRDFRSRVLQAAKN